MNESSAGRKRARIKGRCLARRAEMKQQGFCLSGCPPLSFPQFTPAGWSPRCMNLAVPSNPFCSTSNSILRHPFVSPRLSAFLPPIRAFPLAPPLRSTHPMLHPSYTLNLLPYCRVTMHVCILFAHILSHISWRAIILITSNEFQQASYYSYSVSRDRRYNVPTILSVDRHIVPPFYKPVAALLHRNEMLLPVPRSVNQRSLARWPIFTLLTSDAMQTFHLRLVQISPFIQTLFLQFGSTGSTGATFRFRNQCTKGQ